MRCDTSNRLLRNSSRDYPMMGYVFLRSSRWWVGEFYLLTENTCSEYRIPPQNTPNVFVRSNNKDDELIEQKHWGYFVMGSGTPYPPSPPQKNSIFSPFFPDFSLISGVSPIKPTYIWDFWGPGGGG